MKLVILTLILTLLTACSGKSQDNSSTDFKISLGLSATGVSQLDGGVTLVAKSLDPDVPDFSIDLDENLKADIPFGNYTIYMVGWDGPGAWQGTRYCGSVLILLETAEIDVNITLDQSNCSLTDYEAIILSKGGTIAASWDSATWDSSTWGP